ncbi:MAG: hypothetical protein PVJ84_08145 [Desulfobacteraceae bacterium]|jgi:hypothetical protein
MKSIQTKSLDGDRSYQLARNQILSFGESALEINCLQGLMWVTWPDGNERILKKGQTITVISKGVVCLQAFAAGTIVTRRVESPTPSLFFGYPRGIRLGGHGGRLQLFGYPKANR